MAGPKFKPHDVVEKLTEKGRDGAVKILGYFGSTTNGVVEIYPSLDDLSVCLQVREADIVHVEEAPDDELAHGGSAIWLKPDAVVERYVRQRTSVEARFLAGPIASRMARGRAAVYRAADDGGPAGPNTWSGDECKFSVWPCSVLIGACLSSNDMPCAHTEQWWCPDDIYTAKSCFTCAGYTCVAECHSVVCPPTQRWCPPATFLHRTQCCEVYSAFCRR